MYAGAPPRIRVLRNFLKVYADFQKHVSRSPPRIRVFRNFLKVYADFQKYVSGAPPLLRELDEDHDVVPSQGTRGTVPSQGTQGTCGGAEGGLGALPTTYPCSGPLFPIASISNVPSEGNELRADGSDREKSTQSQTMLTG